MRAQKLKGYRQQLQSSNKIS